MNMNMVLKHLMLHTKESKENRNRLVEVLKKELLNLKENPLLGESDNGLIEKTEKTIMVHELEDPLRDLLIKSNLDGDLANMIIGALLLYLDE